AETAAGWRIEGTASDGSAVFLFAAEKFVAAAPVSGGRFRFEGIREPGPYRVGAMPLSLTAAAVTPAESEPLVAAAATATDRPAFDSSREKRRAAPSAPASPAPVPSVPVLGGLSALPPPGAPDLRRAPPDRHEILVSFDAGSSDHGATEILDALAARGIHTTIFLTGEFIRRYPDIVRRVAADGHEVGNHTDTHPHLTTYAAD